MNKEQIIKALSKYDKDVLVSYIAHSLRHSDEEDLEITFDDLNLYQEHKKTLDNEKALKIKAEKASDKKTEAHRYFMNELTPEAKTLYEKASAECEKAWENYLNPPKAKKKKVVTENLSMFEEV